MGLDLSHNCWHGAYSAFARWREKLAELVGIPLHLMEGYYTKNDLILPDALDWIAPREGGPLCGSYYGPHLHRRITEILKWLPISWSVLSDDPIIVLLNHSDSRGLIVYGQCVPLADRLEGLLPELEKLPDDPGHIGNWADKTRKFIAGLRLAAERGEDVEFH
jgi:hypothetical protein